MSTSSSKAREALEILKSFTDIDLLVDYLRNKKQIIDESDRFPIETKATLEGQLERITYLKEKTGKNLSFLIGSEKIVDLNSVEGNIENFIGFTQIPTGVIGPLRVLGSAAKGDFYVPLATTEGALVASYHRGAKASRISGGITSICLTESVQRSPIFKFNNLPDLGLFLVWILKEVETLKTIPAKVSNYAKLVECRPNIEGNQLILTLEYTTGDAAGQNMVTICSEEVCKYIVEHCPVKPVYWFVESNYSGDKKATSKSFTTVRGKKVTAEVVIPENVVKNILRSTPKAMVEYGYSSTIGVIQSGAIGAQGHVANGLAALFLATGQDVACVAEAAVGITRMELIGEGDLYCSVTLPNLIVGSVGGGTSLSTQKECLELMDCYGAGKARKFAEICAALSLAGELSIVAALSAGHFTSAHKKLGRKK